MRRAAHTAWRRLGEETIVVDLTGRRILGLDPVGGWIWAQLDGRELSTIARSVAELPGAPAEPPAVIDAFVSSLVQLGLVEEGEPLGPAPIPEAPASYERPRVVWNEALQQAAASCGFITGQTPLCTQVPSI